MFQMLSPLFKTTGNSNVIRTNVLILGAGVSGIMCTKALAEDGVEDVLILEARTDAIGGRLRQMEFPANSDNFIELGGNWIQGLGNADKINPIWPLAMKHNISLVTSNDENITYRDDNGLYNQYEFQKRLDEYNAIADNVSLLALSRLQANRIDISARSAYQMLGWMPQNELDYAIEYNSFDFANGESPDVSSLEYVGAAQTFVDFGDRDDFVVDKRGYKHIFEKEAEEAGFGYGSSKLQLGKTVTKITWANNDYSSLDAPLTVETSDGSIYEADYVVTTFSLGVLQSNDVEFIPRLPDWKLEAIHQHHMATYTKMFMSFPYKFWDDSQFVFYGAQRRGEFSNFQNLEFEAYKHHFSGLHMLMATVTGEVSYRIESQSDKDTQDEIMEVLRRMYGESIPDPLHIYVPRWHTDPLYRGSFTNCPVNMVKEQFDNLIAPLHNRLWFSGEHTSWKYFGYVHGALISANKTGHQIADCILSSCPRIVHHPYLVNAEQPIAD